MVREARTLRRRHILGGPPKIVPVALRPRLQVRGPAPSSTSVARDLGVITSHDYPSDVHPPSTASPVSVPVLKDRALRRAQRRQSRYGQVVLATSHHCASEKSILERSSVKANTQTQYNIYLQAFVDFANARGLPLCEASQVDQALVEYYDYVFLMGSLADTADKTIAA